MAKSAYRVFMTNYRAIIKSTLEKIRALNNAFILSDEELKQLDTLHAWITVYHARFMQYTRTNTSKTAFIKMFS